MRVDGAPWCRDAHVLLIGPLGHCSLGTPVRPEMLAAESAGVQSSAKLAMEFFDGNTDGEVRSLLKRVNFFVMKAYDDGKVGDFWASSDEWPPAEATVRTLFLARHGGALFEAAAPRPSGHPERAAAAEEEEAAYLYDPLDPAPMIGGANLPGTVGGICGPADQREREARSDVLLFDTQPLTEDTAVVGNVSARLFVSSSAVDTDFVVTLSDVRPASLFQKETSSLVRYGMVRMRWRHGTSPAQRAPPMRPGVVYEVAVDMGSTAYIVPAGHQIRVSVSSSAHPFISANSNTGVFELVHQVTPVIARNAVHFGADRPSAVTLPVVPLGALHKNEFLRTATESAASVLSTLA